MNKNCEANHLKHLRYAIMHGNKEKVIQLLQRHDIDLMSVNKNGDSLLHTALKYDFHSSQSEIIEILDIFISRGIDINFKNKNQETVLHWAVGKQLEDVVDFLMKHKAKIDVTDREGNSIAHFFVDYLFKQLTGPIPEISNPNFVKWLLSKGFNFDIKNKKGYSALHMVIEYNLQHILPILLEHTNDMNFISESKQETLLHIFLKANNAAKNWHPYDEDITNSKSMCRPKFRLHPDIFTEQYDVLIVEIMLAGGVSVNHVDKHGLTALNLAVDFDEEMDMIEMLLDGFTKVNEKCGVSLIHNIIKKELNTGLDEVQCLQILNTLIAKGADVNCRDEHGMTAVYFAVKHHNSWAIDFLKENGAVDFKVKTKSGDTLLHALAEKNNFKEPSIFDQETLFNLLINKGCNVNAKNNMGETPLHFAVRYGNTTSVQNCIIEILLKHKAYVNLGDKNGETALVKAFRTNQNAAIKILLRYGADSNDIGVIFNITSSSRLSKAKEIVLNHWTKLKAAKLHYSRSYDYFDGDEINQLYEECLREVEILKRTTIVNCKSLFDWLHMDSNNQYIYSHYDKLQNVINSPNFEKQFPLYSTVILGSYCQALARKAIMKLAKKSWFKLTKINLPDVCLERVFIYLSTTDLFEISEVLKCGI